MHMQGARGTPLLWDRIALLRTNRFMGQLDTTRAAKFTAWEGLGGWSGGRGVLLCFHFHFVVVLVQSTLRLLLPPGPSSRTLPCISLPALRRAVPVSHTPIALIQQFVVRNVVLLGIPVYERKCPREERVELQQPRLIYFERL
jgi:hypothetical protein